MARVDDEREHSLGKNCRACGEFVIDTYPGLLYVVDHSNPKTPPQLFDLMVYHSKLLEPVYSVNAEELGLRHCSELVGVTASSILTNNTGKTLGFAQIEAADLHAALKFLQNYFGLVSTWNPKAQLTVGYLQNDLKSPSYKIGYKPAFTNRVITNPSDPVSTPPQSASLAITDLVNFRNSIQEHNEKYEHAPANDCQPTKFAPTLLPATKPSNLIVVQSYMNHLPGTITRAKTHFGCIAYEFPKQTAFFILRYKEAYINAAEQLKAIHAKGWNEKSKLKFLNDLLASYQNNYLEACIDLKFLATHLKQYAAVYSTHGTAAIEHQIRNAIANTPSIMKKL